LQQKGLAGRADSTAFGAQTAAAADPYSKFTAIDTGFQDGSRICLGWIVDGTAIANAYRVQVEKLGATIVAAPLSQSSQSCLGATEINSYVPGSCVVVLLDDRSLRGYILGAAPDVLFSGQQAVHPYISQLSRKRVDDCHKKYIKQPNGGGVMDYSAWRPYDATLAGEWGAITTTGIGVTLDDFMVQMSVNEFCGVTGFYHDSMLRVAGYNMQTWTAGHTRDAIMDQAEYNDTQGYSPFPWEAMGALNPTTDIVQEYQPDTYQCPTGKPYYAYWENKNDYQQPYHRTQHFYGYLGQGGRSVLHAPPSGVDIWTYTPGTSGTAGDIYGANDSANQQNSPPPCKQGQDKTNTGMELKPCIGLHEDNVAMDGRRFIASAKGIVLSKRMLLPMPTRIRPPEDTAGDDAEKNYKAGGYKGEGPEHTITGDFETGTEQPHLQRAGALLDLHGYLFNYVGVHPFHWHAKDFKLWQQSELKYAEYNQKVQDYSTLQGSMYLPHPMPASNGKIKIDHRYKDQKFYETESFISLLEDGSIVIGDGYGAEIKMSAGCLTLSAPGDVWIKSGRSSQLWSGADCIIRSNDGIDISTTEKNVRIKSEENVLILAGNSEEKPGGVLIESRASSSIYNFDQCGDDIIFGGIVLRAPKSEVVTLGSKIYMRTGGGDIPPGNITIDAGRGAADIVTKSSNMYNYVGLNGSIQHFFRSSADDNTKKANSFSQNYTLLAGPVACDRDIVVGGFALIKGSVICADPSSHIFTGLATKLGALAPVLPCNGDCQDRVQPAITELRRYIDTILPQQADTIDKSALEQLWYAKGRPGNTDTIKKMEFSFRTDKQYKVGDGFLLFEDRWQQLARLYDNIPKKWTEKPVTNTVCGKTWPFPGGKWLDGEGYAMVDYSIVELGGDGVRDKDRGEQGSLADPYTAPKFKDIQKQKINGNYPIVGRAP
jgi:hypothetical protein